MKAGKGTEGTRGRQERTGRRPQKGLWDDADDSDYMHCMVYVDDKHRMNERRAREAVR